MGSFAIGLLCGFTVGALFKLIGLSVAYGIWTLVISVIMINWILEDKYGPRF